MKKKQKQSAATKKPEPADGYTPLQPIGDVHDFRSGSESQVLGDRRDGKIYRYTKALKLCINVALATGRPLLLMGPSGCGKSSLAFNLARVMTRRYYEFVVTSRSEARDLFYRFDAVRRLGDAHLAPPDGSLKQDHSETTDAKGVAADPAPGNAAATKDDAGIYAGYHRYIEPGRLWWILNRESALRRGLDESKSPDFPPPTDPAVWQPQDSEAAASVLLIDEIDKAEPDFPNNLLVPLGSRVFTIGEVATSIHLSDAGDDWKTLPFIIITSNQERELPAAFMRRCITFEFVGPTERELVDVGAMVYGAEKSGLLTKLAARLRESRPESPLSIAEYLDLVQAYQELGGPEELVAEILESISWRSGF